MRAHHTHTQDAAASSIQMLADDAHMHGDRHGPTASAARATVHGVGQAFFRCGPAPRPAGCLVVVAQQKKLQLIMYKSQAFFISLFFRFSVRARIYFFPAGKKREKGEKINVQCRPSLTVSVRNPSAIQLACKHTCLSMHTPSDVRLRLWHSSNQLYSQLGLLQIDSENVSSVLSCIQIDSDTDDSMVTKILF